MHLLCFGNFEFFKMKISFICVRPFHCHIYKSVISNTHIVFSPVLKVKEKQSQFHILS